MFRRLTATAALLLTVAAVSACPPPPKTPRIDCARGEVPVTISPGVGLEAGPATVTIDGPSAGASCTDTTGKGLRWVQIVEMSTRFDSIQCLTMPGTTGSGTTRLRWSDGTTSDASHTAVMNNPFDGKVDLRITSGHFAGSSAELALQQWPNAACVDGELVTGAYVFLSGLTIVPPTPAT